MAKDIANIRTYGHINSAVWVAPVGTTAPTAPTTSPGVGWTELGWLGEDGVSEAREVDTDTKKAWQGGVTVRTVRSGDLRRFTFMAMETNATTVGLVRPGSTPETADGVTTTEVKAYTGMDKRAWIIDTRDGDIATRKVIPSGEVVEMGEIVHNSTDVTTYELTVECYSDSNGTFYIEYTNDPGQEVEA